MLTNILFLISEIIIIASFAVPAMSIENSMKDIFFFLTFSSSKNFGEIASKTEALKIFTKIHEKFTLNGYFTINFQFVFNIVITSISYIIVILQFELESARVGSFNVFKLVEIIDY